LRSRTRRIPGLVVTDHELAVPLDHAAAASGRPGEEIVLFAREVARAEHAGEELPWLLFLQGGPGFSAPRPAVVSGWLREALATHRVLLLDQRGTGRSAPVSAAALARLETAESQARHLGLFRADSIVRDAERFRRALLGPDGRWTVLGQSFGGFCTVAYLSLAPEGLAGALITGGLPGLEATADDVYAATVPVVLERNRLYYERYPEDVERVSSLARTLEATDVRLPGGDRLSWRRLRQVGLHFGFRSGFEDVHHLVETAFPAGSSEPVPSYAFLRSYLALLPFDTNPLYALLQEACYAQGSATRWAAEQCIAAHPELAADPRGADAPDGPRFTGETVHPWMFDEIGELRGLAGAAELLAAREDWPRLYDPAALARNEVPAAAVIYCDDMYVPRVLSERTAGRIRGLVPWITNEFLHDGLRTEGQLIFPRLLELARR